MAELFENMDKMDIQAERRNTAEQRLRAETAEREAETAKLKAEAAEQKAEAAEQKAETSISLLIESYRNAGMTWNSVLQRLMEKLGLEENEAKSKIEHYENRT